MRELPQDHWSLEKKQEHHRRRWWKYVCKSEEYVPSVHLNWLVTPSSYCTITKTIVGREDQIPEEITSAVGVLVTLRGFFRVRVSNGSVHTDSRRVNGILYYANRSYLREGFDRKMARGHQIGLSNVWGLQAEKRAEQRAEFAKMEAKKQLQRNIRKRAKKTGRSSEASTAMFFKLSAAASKITA